MSETKFTPGPWRIGTPPPNGQQTIGTEMGMMVAVATTGVGMGEETKANAHLIAAAPDLFSALQAIVAVSETKDDPSWNAIKDCARAALAKARGEKD